jgi:integrase
LEEQAAFGVLGKAGMVFTTTKGQPIHGANLSKVLHAHLDRLGLPRVTCHDLRHSCATVLFSMGVPLPVISDMLGHSTIRVTADLYRHRVPQLSRDAADRMQEAIG